MKENRLSPTIAKLTLFQLEFHSLNNFTIRHKYYLSKKLMFLLTAQFLHFFGFPLRGVRAACFVLFDAGSHFVVNGKGIGVPTFSSKEGKKD